MPAPTRLLAAAVTAAACLGVTAVPAHASLSTDAVVSRGVTIPAFYDPPATLPAADGALIRTEPLPLAPQPAGLDRPAAGYRDPDDVQVHRLERAARRGHRRLHRTVGGLDGRRAAPAGRRGRRHHGAGRPVRRLARPPAPADPQRRDPVRRLRGPGRSTGSSPPASAVVVTDYVGLGTTDRLHTYVNRLDEAHALLDAARAARAVTGASITAGLPRRRCTATARAAEPPPPPPNSSPPTPPT